MSKNIKNKISVKIEVDFSLLKQLNLEKKSFVVEEIDISISGMGVFSKYFVPKGTVVALKLKINNKSMNLKSEICTSVSGESGLNRLGIRFIDLKEKDLEILEEYIGEIDKRNAPRFVLS